MPAETTAKREAGVDLARAFALLLLVMPVSVALNLLHSLALAHTCTPGG